jgi:hypothetical protein
MYVRMYVRMYVCMYVCMYVLFSCCDLNCTFMYIFLSRGSLRSIPEILLM